MRLGVKHANQQQIIRADFSGGLNTSTNIEGIAENQLSSAVNVEIDQATGRLKTVAGTSDVMPFGEIFAAVYDEINAVILLIKEDRSVYAADLSTSKLGEKLGTLSGKLYPVTASWEDGLLIASGGKLQYFNGKRLETIENSPDATSVYIRAGRVLVAEGNTIHYSGVGDETNWTEETNDDSSSKFVEAGYKDGGTLLGMLNLSSDVLMIKNNRRLYRLNGEFPNWQINEVSRNVEVSGRLSFCSVADSVFILGRNAVQNIQTTNAYGDMKPQNIATLIPTEIKNLPADSLLRYVPSLNQLWAVAGSLVLVFDLVVQSWFKREFNSPVVDVIPVGDEVFIVKKDRISRLDEASFYDAGKSLNWKWQGQRLISRHDFLLKRTSLSFIPVNTRQTTGELRVGKVVLNLELDTNNRRYATSKSEYIFGSKEKIYGSRMPIYNRPTVIKESRNVYRSKFLDIGGNGSEGGVIFNSITLDVVEV